MKTDDIQQKIEQFTNGLDADIVVLAHPKDSNQLYIALNGNATIIDHMLFEAWRKVSKGSNMALDDLFRLMTDMVEDGDKNEG